MTYLERHVSPDGLLTLVVEQHDNGDVCIGFLESGWHTHADIQAELSGLAEPNAIRQFVDEILNDRCYVVIERKAGKIEAAYPTDAPQEAIESAEKYAAPDESVEIRRWSGSLKA